MTLRVPVIPKIMFSVSNGYNNITAPYIVSELRFDVFARLILNSLCENSNLPSPGNHDMPARLCNCCMYFL